MYHNLKLHLDNFLGSVSERGATDGYQGAPPGSGGQGKLDGTPASPAAIHQHRRPGELRRARHLHETLDGHHHRHSRRAFRCRNLSELRKAFFAYKVSSLDHLRHRFSGYLRLFSSGRHQHPLDVSRLERQNYSERSQKTVA
jgi:hypothetical protein